MAPKKPAPPLPQSDESEDDYDEPVKKQKKKTHAPFKQPNVAENGGESSATPQAPPKPFNPNDSLVDDEDEDLISMEVPPKPSFIENKDNRSRLMVTKIDVTNFKSYYGSTSIGPFHKNFTSIIGPNGSGKSNVIDSLLFVFGFRSGKIRSKKVSNLIHKSAGKECDNCTVSIHFQKIIDINDEDYEVISGSHFYISRTAYKNNSSTYTMNGKNVSLKEVERKLKEVEVDLSHNRFLILQGEVEAISMMKAKGVNKGEEGMLEYLEDIIGTNRFVLPIAKLEKRLDRLSAVLSQQKIRRENARANKAGMEGDVREAIEFLKLENEVTTIKSKLEQRRKRKYTLQLAPLQEELNEKKEEMKSIGEKLDSNKKGSKDSDKAEKEMTKEKVQLETEYDKVKQQMEDNATEEKKRKQNAKRIVGDVEKMQLEMEKEKKKKDTLVDVPAKAAKKIEKLKSESEDLLEIEKSAKEKADANLVEFDQRSEEYQADKSSSEKEYAEVNAQLNIVKGKASVAQAELSDLKKLADKGKNTLADLKKKLQEAETSFERDSSELEGLEKELPEQQRLQAEANREIPAAKAKENQLDREIREIRGRMDEITGEQARAVTGNRALQALMKEKNEGRIPGFLGRMGDLGAIDAKYDVAISTNCGFLQAYVCETSDDAAKCINFLTNNRLGRSSFISIDKLEDRRRLMNRPASQFPAQRLFDLVKCEDYMKPVFYFALSDVLVVENLGTAQKLDRQHNHIYNFVTLAGDKLSNDGTITGGGQPRKGLIGSELKVRRDSTDDSADQIRRMNEELKRKQEEYEKALDIARTFDRQLFESRQQCNVLSARIKVLKSAIEQTKPKIETLRRTIGIQEKEAEKTNVDEKEIEEKQKKLDDLIRVRDEAAEKASDAKRRVDEIVGKIDAIFNELVECHKSEAKDAHDKRAAIEKTIAKETGAINNSERNIGKCDERIAQLEKDIEKKNTELERLNEHEMDEEKVEEQKASLKQMEEALKELDVKFKEMREQKNSLSKEELELEKGLKEAAEKVGVLKMQISESTRKVEEIQATISKLRLNNVPRLAFLNVQSRPEEMRMELEEEIDLNRFVDLPQDELEKVQKKVASEYADQVYTLEYQMRNDAANEPELIDESMSESNLVPILSDEDLANMDQEEVEEIQFRKKTYEQKLEAMKAKVNLSIIEEYIQKVKKYNEETISLNEMTGNYNAHRLRCLFFKKNRFEEFHEAFNRLVNAVREVYQMLTLGGDANLVYKSGTDPFSEGIQFVVRPNKKAWKNIENLSGGEKTLSSLSLVFALHTFRPTPFYVMDEIDAALDYRNVSIIGQYVKERTQNAQFIIISLRNNMFELANRLVGIYKVDDCTQNVAIDPLRICANTREISRRLGENTIVMPDEVSREFHRLKNEKRKEQNANEKQYENFPSTSDIARAEKIVGIESKVRKVISRKDNRPESVVDPSRATSAASTKTMESSRPQSQLSSRPESRIVEKFNLPQARLVRANDDTHTKPLSATSRQNSVPREASESIGTPPAAKRMHSEPITSSGLEVQSGDEMEVDHGINGKDESTLTESRSRNTDENVAA